MDKIKTMAAKRPKLLRLGMVNDANLGHFESKMGINGHKKEHNLKIRQKLGKFKALSRMGSSPNPPVFFFLC